MLARDPEQFVPNAWLDAAAQALHRLPLHVDIDSIGDDLPKQLECLFRCETAGRLDCHAPGVLARVPERNGRELFERLIGRKPSAQLLDRPLACLRLAVLPCDLLERLDRGGRADAPDALDRLGP